MITIYEQDFYDFSYGFRVKRSAHQVLVHLRQQCMRRSIKWLYDADIQSCFDNFIIGFENQEDALRVTQTLPKRMDKYGLSIHPEKSKLIKFSPEGEGKPPTFDFLGFTHYWTKSQRGNWIVKRKTCQKKMQAIVKNLRDTCKMHKHEKLKDQSKLLKQKLRGLYQYFGIRGNSIAINRMYQITIYAWFKWLNRRSQRKSYTWKGYGDVLKYFQLPKPRIIHYNV